MESTHASRVGCVLVRVAVFLALDAWAIAVPPHLLWLRETFFGSKSSIEDYSLLGK